MTAVDPAERPNSAPRSAQTLHRSRRRPSHLRAPLPSPDTGTLALAFRRLPSGRSLRHPGGRSDGQTARLLAPNLDRLPHGFRTTAFVLGCRGPGERIRSSYVKSGALSWGSRTTGRRSLIE
jgi:hypothetical protein